jgi:tetratricopeptide (TPR) repeat protein
VGFRFAPAHAAAEFVVRPLERTMMKKVLETIQNFIPLLVQFPQWVQVFFFAVVLQLLLLFFIMFIYYVYPRKSISTNASNVNKVQEENVISNIPSLEKDKDPALLTKGVEKVDLNKFKNSKDPNVAVSLSNLAQLYEAQGRYKQAEEIWIRVLSIYEAAYGTEHPIYADTLQALARLHTETGKLQDALKLQKTAHNIIEKIFGSEHPKTASSLNRLAVIYLKLARYAEAAPLIEKAIAIRESSLGADHPELIELYENLLSLYNQAGDYSKSQAVASRIKELREKFPDK